MVVDEPRPHRRKDTSFNARTPWPNAGNTQTHSERGCQHTAEGWDDFVYAGKCDDPEPSEVEGRGLRLLRNHSTANGQMASGSSLTSTLWCKCNSKRDTA